MPRLASPRIQDLTQTDVPEQVVKVATKLDKQLEQNWEIYTSPHMNGHRPDLVLLNPHKGIVVLNVINAGSTIEDHSDTLIAIDLMMHVKNYVLDLYCPTAGKQVAEISKSKVIVMPGLVYPFLSQTDATRHFLSTLRFKPKDLSTFLKYYLIIGKEQLSQSDSCIPWDKYSQSVYMNKQIADELRSWLIEPDISVEQREPILLDARQRSLVENRQKISYRRIKGPAGSGKTLVIAGRATRLAMERKKVLIITYNICLISYVKDLCARFKFTFNHEGDIHEHLSLYNIHFYFRKICLSAGFGKEYSEIWANFFDTIRHQGTEVRPDGGDLDYLDISLVEQGDDELLNDILENQIPALAERALNSGKVDKYDAILVDEGQDLNPKWWRVLRKALSRDGEVLLVADQMQDVYGRGSLWTEESMIGSGFRGNWIHLMQNYRLPSQVVEPIKQFINTYLGNPSEEDPQLSVTGQEELFPLRTWWYNTIRSELVEKTGKLIKKLPTQCFEQLSFPDIYFLTTNHRLGEEITAYLAINKINVDSVFAVDSSDRKHKKMGFCKGTATVKGATIFSFKGWEARAIVLIIDETIRDVEKLKRLFYVGLTRLKWHDEGSYLVIVNTVEDFKKFGDYWNFQFSQSNLKTK